METIKMRVSENKKAQATGFTLIEHDRRYHRHIGGMAMPRFMRLPPKPAMRPSSLKAGLYDARGLFRP
jgi:hypothetical protein